MNSTSQDCESINEKPIKKEHHVESDVNDTKNTQDILKGGTEGVEHLKEAKVDSEIAITTTEPGAPTTPDTAETKDKRRACHPQLGDQSKYYIDKEGVIYVKRNTCLRPAVPRPPLQYAFPSYFFQYGKTNISIRLDEIMVETFLGPIDMESQYIIHKDGNKENHALSNLAVGDLDTLRKFQIEHFKKLEPDTQYVKVKDLHDTLTFDDYLISNTGTLFCLSRQRHYPGYTRPDGYICHPLQSDPKDGIRVRKTFLLHRVVFHSFHGRLTNDSYLVYHVNGDRSDNSSDNLKCGPRKDIANGAYKPVNKAARRKNMEQGLYSRQNKAMLEPLPPATEQTKWKTIGVLPWNGRSFSNYQVSDAGHVRRMDGKNCRVYTHNGYVRVRIVSDKLDDESGAKDRSHLAMVSRLVAHAFVDGYSETTCHVMHHNRNILDNRAENLQWIRSHSSRSRKVIVTLVHDPTAVKEYPTTTKAKQDLGTSRIYPTEDGGSYVRQVRWHGVMQDARIQVL